VSEELKRIRAFLISKHVKTDFKYNSKYDPKKIENKECKMEYKNSLRWYIFEDYLVDKQENKLCNICLKQIFDWRFEMAVSFIKEYEQNKLKILLEKNPYLVFCKTEEGKNLEFFCRTIFFFRHTNRMQLQALLRESIEFYKSLEPCSYKRWLYK